MSVVYEGLKSDAIIAVVEAKKGKINQVYGAAKMAKQLGAIDSHQLAMIKEILFKKEGI